MDKFFIASGIVFEKGVEKSEVERMVQQTIDENFGGYAKFRYDELDANTIRLTYFRQEAYASGSEYIYDSDMTLISGIGINAFQARPVGNPIIYPIKFGGKNFYTKTAAFLRLYKFMLFKEDQQVEDIKARIYSDRIIIEINY